MVFSSTTKHHTNVHYNAEKKISSVLRQNTLLSIMTAVTFPLRPPRLAFAICGWRWQNDVYKNKV